VTTSAGNLVADFENDTALATPITIDPGDTATFTVTIRPTGDPGSVASGTLYLEVLSTAALIDGGIADRPVADRVDARAPAVLYTGTKASWGGLDLLLKAWRGVRHAGARLWICGPGRSAELQAAAAKDPRIQDFGMVSETRLQELTEQAAVQIDTGEISGEKPVAAQGGFGTLTATDGFKVLERGNVVHFLGKSHAVLEAEEK
jgi:hypothetical protein